jgi:hypothetical protein
MWRASLTLRAATWDSSTWYAPPPTSLAFCRLIQAFFSLTSLQLWMQTGHGVSPELSRAVLDVGHEFFSLSESQKLRIGMSTASGFRL